ncbi:MAG: hypothetical protein WDA22_15320 [Bacteroidota bacterium]
MKKYEFNNSVRKNLFTAIKIISMIVLFSTIFLLDLLSFIPVLIIILLILNSVEKDFTLPRDIAK